MAMIVEAYARWTDAVGEDEARACLSRFCDAIRADETNESIERTLPDDAHFAAATTLFALRRLEAVLGRRLGLVLDAIGILQADGTYLPHLGIAIGSTAVERIDDLGATTSQARTMALTLRSLLESFEPESAGCTIVD